MQSDHRTQSGKTLDLYNSVRRMLVVPLAPKPMKCTRNDCSKYLNRSSAILADKFAPFREDYHYQH